MEQRRGKRRREVDDGSWAARIWVVAFTILLSAITLSASPSGSTSTGSGPAATAIARRDVQLTEYRALRRMHAKSDRFNQEGWMDAVTELDASGFRYTVVSERGSEYLRTKVLRAILQREQDLIAEGHAHRAALTEDNYVFTDEEGAEDGYRYVVMKPKRKEVTLVDGRMVLRPDGSLVRIEGKLAKNPSFWTSLVNVIRRFATVDGVQVPVSTESVAKVKLAGQSRLDVFYEYESINGRPVSIAARQTLASATRRVALPE